MNTVYEALKVKLQRSKNDPVLAGVKHTYSSHLDEKIEELAQRTVELKGTIKQREEEIRNETDQVVRALSENVATLEAKLKDTEESARKNEAVSQKIEEQLTFKIHSLQDELNAEKEALQSRDQEIVDLKSETKVLVKQVADFEIATQQQKAEAAAEATRAEELIESFNAKVAALESQVTETMEIIQGKEETITALEQKLAAEIQQFENQLKDKASLLADQDAEINHLRSKVEVLTGKIQKLSSFLKQAEALASIEVQTTSNEHTTVAQETMAPEVFVLIRQQLARILGSNAEMILRDRVAALGESIDNFPNSRLYDLLESVSKEIKNEPLRISFRKWFVKHVYRSIQGTGL
jgi:DNA repair exonuclease SbcCD ATPase subunit